MSVERNDEESLRSRAITVLKKRRDFRAHLLIYLLMNGAFALVWAITSPHHFFWPVIPMVFWGIGVVMNGWDVYVANDFSEEKIERQMRHLQQH